MDDSGSMLGGSVKPFDIAMHEIVKMIQQKYPNEDNSNRVNKYFTELQNVYSRIPTLPPAQAISHVVKIVHSSERFQHDEKFSRIKQWNVLARDIFLKLRSELSNLARSRFISVKDHQKFEFLMDKLFDMFSSCSSGDPSTILHVIKTIAFSPFRENFDVPKGFFSQILSEQRIFEDPSTAQNVENSFKIEPIYRTPLPLKSDSKWKKFFRTVDMKLEQGYLNSCSALKNHFFEKISSHSLKNPRFSLFSNYEGAPGNIANLMGMQVRRHPLRSRLSTILGIEALDRFRSNEFAPMQGGRFAVSRSPRYRILELSESSIGSTKPQSRTFRIPFFDSPDDDNTLRTSYLIVNVPSQSTLRRIDHEPASDTMSSLPSISSLSRMIRFEISQHMWSSSPCSDSSDLSSDPLSRSITPELAWLKCDFSVQEICCCLHAVSVDLSLFSRHARLQLIPSSINKSRSLRVSIQESGVYISYGIHPYPTLKLLVPFDYGISLRRRQRMDSVSHSFDYLQYSDEEWTTEEWRRNVDITEKIILFSDRVRAMHGKSVKPSLLSLLILWNSCVFDSRIVEAFDE